MAPLLFVAVCSLDECGAGACGPVPNCDFLLPFAVDDGPEVGGGVVDCCIVGSLTEGMCEG